MLVPDELARYAMPQHQTPNPLGEILNPPHVHKRCGAESTRSGEPCQRWAAIGWTRCRIHGGAPGSGRPPIHGRRTKHAQRQRLFLRIVKALLNHYYGHEKLKPIAVPVARDGG